jgi:hypothetical protein
MKLGIATSVIAVGALIYACSSDDSGDGDDNNQASCDIPAWITDNFSSNVTVTCSGSSYTFTTDDVPNHQSAYFETSDSRYTSTMPTGRNVNPNKISEQSYTFTIPTSPSPSSNGVATEYNAIGVATDGVVFFNNEAAAPQTLADEISSLDTANGHPTNVGAYHYHIEPVEITDDDASLIGILRDGYPVFGKRCPSTNEAPTDLDDFNGHESDTGIEGLGTTYHYHVADIASDDGDGVSEPVITNTYYGTPGNMVHN